MSHRKSVSSPLKVAPEFSGPGSLARALKGDAAPSPALRSVESNGDDPSWVVLGVSALWQTAAENAARRSGLELSEWLRQAVSEAAAAEGVSTPLRD